MKKTKEQELEEVQHIIHFYESRERELQDDLSEIRRDLRRAQERERSFWYMMSR